MKKEDNKRRIFLKKLAYSAPVVTLLGQLAKPIQSKAGGSQPDPPPGGGGGGFPPGF